MTRLSYYLLIALAAFGCGGSLTAPDPVPQPPRQGADVARISGRIYSSVGPAYASIPNAVIEVNEADGTSATAVSDNDGAYTISARLGAITITASKEGYEAKQWQFDLLNDTVLNFSLNPQ